MKYTETQDPFIGQRFGKEGQIEVLGVAGKSGREKSYYVKCHTCYQNDPGLWEAPSISNKSRLQLGTYPCSCGGKCNWTQAQYQLRVDRECSRRGYKVLSYAAPWDKGKTKITLECPEHGVWSTSNVKGLLLGHGCVSCGIRDRSLTHIKSDDTLIESFMKSGSYTNENVFWKSSRENHWYFTCPICSHDKYVEEGLCDGVFEAQTGNLQKGIVCCRCSTRAIKTQVQIEFDLRERLSTEGGSITFLGFQGSYINKRSKIVLQCSCGNCWRLSLGSFTRGHKCNYCNREIISSSTPSHIYIIDVEGVAGDFVGYGITSYLKDRLKEHSSNLSQYGFRISNVQTFETSRFLAKRIEDTIKAKFPLNSQEVCGFRTEATFAGYLNEVALFVEDELLRHKTLDNLYTV